MFEKEGFKWTEKNISVGISMYNPSIEMYCGKAFKDGAEFGYNKANEWHYPSKGELPKENLLCLIQMKSGTFEIAYRVTDLCWKYKHITFGCSFQSEIYAWKEIVLPKESE